MSDKPSVSLVVLNWNGKELLNDFLKSIHEKTEYPNYEVRVVDNGSEDGSQDMVEENYPEVELVENEKNLGFSIGNNIGIMNSGDSDYYLLLNNDMEARQGWLGDMVSTAEERNAGITGAKLFYPDGKIQHAGGKVSFSGPNHIGLNQEDEYYEDREVEYVTGAAMMIRRDVVEDIGYLDEILSPASNEDTDYCFRASEAGYSIVFSSDAELTHYEGKTREQESSGFDYFMERKNEIKFSLMNLHGKRLLKSFVNETKHFGAAVLGYRQNYFFPLMKAYREVLLDLPELLRKRYNREEYIPSYYCEDIRDYSKRYR
ncbi:MAG: glycosyltransferase family 2 protein [Candidatus Nanosalina sp.]